MKLTLGMSKLKFSLSETHPNKMIIEGCITQVGVPSTGAPCGSDGRNIVFTKESVDTNVSTFDMMPVNCTFPEDWEWSPGTEVFTGHGNTNIGVIEKAWSEGTDLMAKMVVWKALFPDVAFMTVNGQAALGFSIECNADKTHDGIDDGFLYIDEFTGLGTAMLWKNTAAFGGTYIRELIASREKTKDGNEMTEEQMKALLDAMMTEVKASISEVKASVETMVTEVKAEVDKANTQVEALAVGLVETREEIKASKAEPVVEPVIVQASVEPVVVAPTVLAAGQTVIPNANITQVDEKALKIKEINASAMSPMEKAKAITKLKYAE